MLIVACFRGFDETKVWGQCIYKKLQHPAVSVLRRKRKKKSFLKIFLSLEETRGRRLWVRKGV